MKKLLSTVALGLIVGLSASAAAPQIQIEKNNLASKEIKKANPVISSEQIKNTPIAQNSRRSVKHKIATQEDFCGAYQWVGRDVLNEKNPYENGIFTIDINPDNPDRVRIFGLDIWLEYLDGYVDNGRLYVPNQFESLYEEINQQAWFINYTIINNGYNEETESYEYYFTRSNKEFYFTLDENGYIYAGTPLDEETFEAGGYTDAQLEEMVCAASSNLPYYDPDQQGFFYGFWLCLWIQGQPVATFEYNEAEWVHAGTVQFVEPWFQVWYEGEAPEYEVELYRSKAANTQFMLMHPFGEGTPWENVTEGTEPGYVLFSIGDPGCVLLQPLVYSLTMPLNVTGEVMEYETYCYNEEGYLYFIEQETTDDIRLRYVMDRKSISNFDEKTRTVNLYNGKFSVKQMLLNPMFYEDDAYGYIILPEGYLTNAVEAIGVDDINTPEVYYNLQGVKLQAPEKGQVVIVRKGNKASKMIVR